MIPSEQLYVVVITVAVERTRARGIAYLLMDTSCHSYPRRPVPMEWLAKEKEREVETKGNLSVIRHSFSMNEIFASDTFIASEFN